MAVTLTNYWRKSLAYYTSSSTYTWVESEYAAYNAYIGPRTTTEIHVSIYKFTVDKSISSLTFQLTRSENSVTYDRTMYAKLLTTDTNTTYYNPNTLKSNADVSFTFSKSAYGTGTATINKVLSAGTYYIYVTCTDYINTVYDNVGTHFSGVLSVEELLGTIGISNGSSFDNYFVYIYNGSGWDQYLPYIYDGSNWVLCGI